VVGCQDGHMLLKDGTQVPFGFALWCAGIAPVPLVKNLPVEKDRIGRIITDPYLRVLHQPDVYAFGDCGTIEGYPQPQTAQVAAQQGKYLSRCFNKGNENILPFAYHHRGSMAYVGRYKALIDHPKYKSSGFWSFFMWRSFYLTNAVSLKNKMLIPMYWFLTLLFGRDTSIIAPFTEKISVRRTDSQN